MKKDDESNILFGKITLLKNVSIQGSNKNIDYVWISENLIELLQTHLGKRVRVEGNVRIYNKGRGKKKQDYCINNYHAEIIDRVGILLI